MVSIDLLYLCFGARQLNFARALNLSLYFCASGVRFCTARGFDFSEWIR
jgi:hypothetical protein